MTEENNQMSLNISKQWPTLSGYYDTKDLLKGARNGKLSKSKDLNGSQGEQVILDTGTNAFKILSKNRIKL